jgi:hypothetical protein
MNLQTSFLTPPFGFALFYLRSVAAKSDYKDRVTGETIPAVATSQIYKGSIAFIILQLVMVAVVIAYPGLVTGGIDAGVKVDADKALQEMTDSANAAREPQAASSEPAAAASEPEGAASEPGKSDEAEDPMKALEEAIKKDQADKK